MKQPNGPATVWARRHFLRQSGLGLGALALQGLWGRSRGVEANGPATDPLVARPPLRPGRAKRLIYLHMSGAPPQMDLFDYKPQLNAWDGQPCPKSFFEGKRLAFTKGHPTLLGSPHRFQRVGRAGRWVSDLLPHFATISDDVAMIHSMTTDEFNHAPAELLMFTGTALSGGA
jgi:Protein of unknown function (DUF1501)